MFATKNVWLHSFSDGSTLLGREISLSGAVLVLNGYGSFNGRGSAHEIFLVRLFSRGTRTVFCREYIMGVPWKYGTYPSMTQMIYLQNKWYPGTPKYIQYPTVNSPTLEMLL